MRYLYPKVDKRAFVSHQWRQEQRSKNSANFFCYIPLMAKNEGLITNKHGGNKSAALRVRASLSLKNKLNNSSSCQIGNNYCLKLFNQYSVPIFLHHTWISALNIQTRKITEHEIHKSKFWIVHHSTYVQEQLKIYLALLRHQCLPVKIVFSLLTSGKSIAMEAFNSNASTSSYSSFSYKLGVNNLIIHSGYTVSLISLYIWATSLFRTENSEIWRSFWKELSE